MLNYIAWFDIPVIDLDRAIKFYSEVLASSVTKQETKGLPTALFAHEGEEPVGCLSTFSGAPSSDGPLLYFRATGRLDAAVELVEKLGGKVLFKPHSIAPFGSRAIVLDSEGNRIALYSI